MFDKRECIDLPLKFLVKTLFLQEKQFSMREKISLILEKKAQATCDDAWGPSRFRTIEMESHHQSSGWTSWIKNVLRRELIESLNDTRAAPSATPLVDRFVFWNSAGNRKENSALFQYKFDLPLPS